MSHPVTVEKFAVGQSVRRLEDPRLVQGLGRYSDDVNLARQAYAVVVRSPHAHARIRGIDARRRAVGAGVLAVLTGADLAADGLGNLPDGRPRKRRDGSPAFTPPAARACARSRPPRRRSGGPRGGRDARAGGRRRRAGRRRLRAAARRGGDGRGRSARARRPCGTRSPDNVAFVWEAGQRDAVARAFASAAHVTRLDFVVTRVAAAPLEPRAAVGEYDRRTGRYTLHTGIQGPHGLRTLLADDLQGAAEPPARGHRRGRAAASGCAAASTPSWCWCCGRPSGWGGR